LREVFRDLTAPLGRTLDVDALDRVVLVAHSGGYQAAAGSLALGDVPRVTEVALLDALYGGDDVFRRWVIDQAGRFDTRASQPLRFVDLYTCCGGTKAGSEELGRDLRIALTEHGLAAAVDASALTHPVVVKLVPEAHAAVPHTYLRPLLEAAGFQQITQGTIPAHPLRLN
jgi:hypothetical protein